MSDSKSPVFVGIDVSAKRLDVAVDRAAVESFTNEDAGIAALCRRLNALSCELIVLEATGGYEALVVASLAAAGLPVRVLNPRQVRDFARATGLLAKTDRLDAQVLRDFAERLRPVVLPQKSEQQRELSAIVSRRRELVQMLVAEKNRLKLAIGSVRGLRAASVPREAHRSRHLCRGMPRLSESTSPSSRARVRAVSASGLRNARRGSPRSPRLQPCAVA